MTRRFATDGVLFDLDGTLLDTLPDLADAAARMLDEMRRPPRTFQEIHTFVGKGIPNLVRRCLSEGYDVDEATIESGVASFKRHYAQVNGLRTTIYPGVVEALQALASRAVRLACVTNKATAFTLPLLEKTGLAPYFSSVVCGDTLASKKPDPAMLLHACTQLQIAPARALMVGDSANDALAAQAAGMPVLLLPYGYSEGIAVDRIECDGLISSAMEVLDRIESA